MAKDLGDAIGTVVGKVARETAQNVVQNARKSKNGPVSGVKGVAAGAALAAAAPLAIKGARFAKRGLSGDGDNPLKKPVEKAGEKVKSAASDVVDKKVSDMGGAGGIAKEGAKSLIPGLGGGDDDQESKDGKGKKGGTPGVGKGRRMPVQQSVDIGVPLEKVYSHFTQFEEWPTFMHRVTSVSQDDETHIDFKAKIWTRTREFKAEIDEQRPEERIQWHVAQGFSHKGVVTFHPLAPGLTRIELSVDVEPGSLIEKFARGARHVKRAMRADLHRFKAYVMMNEEPEDEGWRGWIEDGEVTSSEGDDDHHGWQQDGAQHDEQEQPQDEGGESQARRSTSRSRSSNGGGGSSRSGSSRSRSSNGESGSSRSSSSRSSSGRAKAASSSGGRSRKSPSGSSSGRSRSSSSGSSSGRGRSSKSSGSSSSSSRRSSRSSSGSNGSDPKSSRSSSSSSRRKSGSRS